MRGTGVYLWNTDRCKLWRNLPTNGNWISSWLFHWSSSLWKSQYGWADAWTWVGCIPCEFRNWELSSGCGSAGSWCGTFKRWNIVGSNGVTIDAAFRRNWCIFLWNFCEFSQDEHSKKKGCSPISGFLPHMHECSLYAVLTIMLSAMIGALTRASTVVFWNSPFKNRDTNKSY